MNNHPLGQRPYSAQLARTWWRLGWVTLSMALTFIAASGFAQEGNSTTTTAAENSHEVQVVKDVSYYDRPDRDQAGYQTLDLYVPKGAAKAPVLIFVHGGGWTHKENDPYTRGRLGPHNPFFASHGVVVASISYRLSPEHQHPAHVEDVARAIAWVKANVVQYGGDPDQIFLIGHSAGGHLVTLVVADPKYLLVHHLSASDVRGVMPISAPFTVGKNGDRIDTIWGSQAAADDASPINHVRVGLPAFLIFAGDQGSMEEDRTEQAKGFVDLLHEKGVEAAFVQARDRDHSTIVTKLGTAGDAVAERMLQFIRDHRTLERPPPAPR